MSGFQMAYTTIYFVKSSYTMIYPIILYHASSFGKIIYLYVLLAVYQWSDNLKSRLGCHDLFRRSGISQAHNKTYGASESLSHTAS